jgi:hypothetical protein
MGVAKTARKTANSGQFSATFYGLFPTPHFFVLFMLWSVSGHGFLKSRKSELQTPSRLGSGRGVWRGVWNSFPGAAPDWGLGGGSGGGSRAASQELLQTAPGWTPDWGVGLESATRPDHTWRKSVLPSWQVCSSHPNLSWHAMTGWGGLSRLAKQVNRLRW